MGKRNAIPKATKFESGRNTRSSTKAGKAKEVILGEARWGNKIVIKRFKCDAEVEGENAGPCTSTFTRHADMVKHKRLHDPTKQGWYFCDHCEYACAQKYAFDSHVKDIHGGRAVREIIFCMMKRRGTQKTMCGWTCHTSSQMSYHRTHVHRGATSKTSPRLTLIQGSEGEYTIPWTFRSKTKLRLPPGIYYNDQIPLQPSAEPSSTSPLSPIPSSDPSPSRRAPSPLPLHSSTPGPSQAPPRIPPSIPQLANPWSYSSGLDLLANTAEIYGKLMR